MLVESLLLALIGGAVGVGVAYAAVPVIVALGPAGVPGIADATVNGPVLAFTLVIAAATGVLFAWAPILETRPAHLRTILGDAARSATLKKTRLDGVLIGAEVALALVLLAGAALMMKSLWRLQVYPAGFSPERTYTMRVPLSGPRYEAFDRKLEYISQLLGRLEATPGVEAAGISASTYHLSLRVQGKGVTTDQPRLVAVRMVSSGYLRAMGVSLIRGRWPAVDEERDAMVVNETFARTMLPKGDPIDTAITGSFVSGTVVGIVADFPYSQLDGERAAELYYPYQRSPATRSIGVAVRMSPSAVATVQQLASDLDRTQPVYEFRSLEESLATSIAPRRFNTLLIGTFAVGALLMAVAGTFGVVARTVTRRTREAAIRIALGARPADVVLMIVRQAMVHTIAGMVVGVLAALAVGRTLRGLLHGVEPDDPAMIAVAAAVMVLSGLVASSVPALKAARVDPLAALRTE
jgi:putative ABC transport system permease protein